MTKTKTKWLISALSVMAVIFIASSYTSGANECYSKTFRNNDVVDANDFNAVALYPKSPGHPGQPIKSAAAKDVNGVKAFDDQAFGTAVNSFYWTPAQCQKVIKPDKTMTVSTTGGPIDGNNSYFTHRGVKIQTCQVPMDTEIRPENGSSGIIEFRNIFGAATITLSSVEVRINNTAVPGLWYTPDGSLVSGIPSSFSLSAGETKTFPYTGSDPSKAISISKNVALASDPSVQYPELMAQIPASIVPTVSEWGLIIMGLLLLTVGAVVIWRRFKTVPA